MHFYLVINVSYYTFQLIDHLFDAGETGLDLIAFNIQRSRDHGLPGYVEYRSKCQLGEVKSFGQLSSNIEADVSIYLCD